MAFFALAENKTKIMNESNLGRFIGRKPEGEKRVRNSGKVQIPGLFLKGRFVINFSTPIKKQEYISWNIEGTPLLSVHIDYEISFPDVIS